MPFSDPWLGVVYSAPSHVVDEALFGWVQSAAFQDFVRTLDPSQCSGDLGILAAPPDFLTQLRTGHILLHVPSADAANSQVSIKVGVGHHVDEAHVYVLAH